MKELIKKVLKKLPVAITQNQKYDSQTTKVISRVCSAGSSCIDIGAHKGEVLDIMLKYAPNGTHYAFEPIPDMYKNLVTKYKGMGNCKIYDYALSNNTGTASFNYVISNPSYSGLVKRKYDRDNEEDTKIEVKTELLDNVLPGGYMPNFMKIDVEGGELLVLEGAKKTISSAKPVIIFEHGLGASECYGSTPEKVYELLTSCGLVVSTMHRWLNNKPQFTEKDFCDHYYKKLDYYFIAYPL
ncbi:MAG: FkbM family methyltransferase [Chitinophagaceae bacterium]|nr:FkbM family methyltransferase [Chitinophagaceae bacterium]MCB9044787.1 FkbM family methyltransferase [Chitinophagales bacterium]